MAVIIKRDIMLFLYLCVCQGQGSICVCQYLYSDISIIIYQTFDTNIILCILWLPSLTCAASIPRRWTAPE